MNRSPHVLLLVGSAKPPGHSTSESLGGYLCDRLVAHGWTAQSRFVHQCLRTEERTRALLDAVDAADLFLLAAPLYVDGLPHLVTAALERIAAHRAERDATVRPRFAGIVNCGFPEAQHNDVALAICEQFAGCARMTWAGGLSMGGGGVVHGTPLAESGNVTSGIRRALELAADALAAGESVPDEAVSLLAQPAIPARLYTAVGNVGWYGTAWRQHTLRRLHDRPYSR